MIERKEVIQYLQDDLRFEEVAPEYGAYHTYRVRGGHRENSTESRIDIHGWKNTQNIINSIVHATGSTEASIRREILRNAGRESDVASDVLYRVHAIFQDTPNRLYRKPVYPEGDFGRLGLIEIAETLRDELQELREFKKSIIETVDRNREGENNGD